LNRAQIAYAHARIAARKSRLLRRVDAMPLWSASDPAAVQRALTALGIGSERERFARLLSFYRTAIRGYAHRAPLLWSLLRLHEIENLKLGWRALIRRIAPQQRLHLWRDLEEFTALRPEVFRHADSIGDLLPRLAGTPYADVASQVSRAHGDDVAGAELAFDQWASKALLAEAHRLPSAESLAHEIIITLLHERDEEMLRRGAAFHGLSPAAVQASIVVSPKRTHTESTLRRRAFVGHSFEVAPALAILLLAEAESRSVTALIERRGDPRLDEPTTRVVANSLMGS
jgi:hypothetical protein